MLVNDDTMMNGFEMTKRCGLIVWVYNLRQLKNLKRHGTVVYVSRKMKYVVLYIDDAEKDKIIQTVSKLHFVRSVALSHRQEVAAKGNLTEIMSDMTETAEDFVYNGKPVTPLIMNK